MENFKVIFHVIYYFAFFLYVSNVVVSSLRVRLNLTSCRGPMVLFCSIDKKKEVKMKEVLLHLIGRPIQLVVITCLIFRSKNAILCRTNDSMRSVICF
jgi:hypothetical protein